MRRPDFIAKQAAHPSGMLGRFLFWVMAAETKGVNQRTLQFLAPETTSHLLEVGFGHGRTLVTAAKSAPGRFVPGIDISADMVRLFRIHNRSWLTHGLIEVKHASSDQIPYPNAHFDRSDAVHTLYFWKDPLVHLGEIRRVTRPGGRFVLTFTPKENADAIASFPDTVYRFYSIEEVRELLQRAGFGNAEVRRERSRRKIPRSRSPNASSLCFQLQTVQEGLFLAV